MAISSNAPFCCTFESGNIAAVRIFSEQLTGDSQAQANHHHCGSKSVEYLPAPFKPEDFARLLKMADVLLRVMPDLSLMKLFGAIQLQDKDFGLFWQRREGANPLYRAYYSCCRGKLKRCLPR